MLHKDWSDAHLSGVKALKVADAGWTPAPFDTFTAADLERMQFPPINYVVPGYVAEGLTILAGKPKLGKSWRA